jgi:hypothetical protein
MSPKMFMNVFFLFILPLGACGKNRSYESKTLDIVSPFPGPVKLLKSNVQLSPRLKALWTSYGYQENQNCLQYVDNLKTDGTKFETVEFYQGPCQVYPNQSVPLMRMRLLKDNSVTVGYFWLIPIEINSKVIEFTAPVGNIQFENSSPKLMTFCDLDLASSCDLSMTRDGKIEAVSLKKAEPWIRKITVNFVNTAHAAHSEPDGCNVEMPYDNIVNFISQAPYADYESLIQSLKNQSNLSNTSFDSNLLMMRQCALNKH